jgi:hypothetical protein
MKKLFIFCIVILSIYGCNNNPVYQDYYANVRSEFYTLSPAKWMQAQGSAIQWYQEFNLPVSRFNNLDNIGVMVYYLNQYNAWEALPSTRIFWTDKGVVYSDELWFSHNTEFLYIDYRNTIPGVAAPPKDPIQIKAVYFDGEYFTNKIAEKINWNDYNDVKQKLNLKD